MSDAQDELVRREALGAFVHDMRTPLTSLRMVVGLGRQGGNGRDLMLDEELSAMLTQSLDSIERLVDELQESSHLERGKTRLAVQPCPLGDIVRSASGRFDGRLAVDVAVERDVTGEWDVARLTEAIAGLVDAAYRTGDGRSCTLIAGARRDGAIITVRSGEPGEGGRGITAELGFEFFRGWTALRAMGATIGVIRGARAIEITVQLPVAHPA